MALDEQHSTCQTEHGAQARPSPAHYHGRLLLPADPSNGFLYALGGLSHAYQRCLDDVWRLNLGTGAWARDVPGEAVNLADPGLALLDAFPHAL